MNETKHVTYSDALEALDRCLSASKTQGCTIATSFGLLRGHSWAISTSIDEAIELARDQPEPELRARLVRAFEIQQRGPDCGSLSVADCSRVHWARRCRNGWEDYLSPMRGAPWPGGSGWFDLRVILETRERGATHTELARELQLPARSIRQRIARLKLDPAWMGVVPLL